MLEKRENPFNSERASSFSLKRRPSFNRERDHPSIWRVNVGT
jgi:hypothetical protein